MEEVKIGRVYRQFKGNYYLYKREDGRSIWVRPEKMFLEEIPERPDNITGQKHRFELVDEIEKNYIK